MVSAICQALMHFVRSTIIICGCSVSRDTDIPASELAFDRISIVEFTSISCARGTTRVVLYQERDNPDVYRTSLVVH